MLIHTGSNIKLLQCFHDKWLRLFENRCPLAFKKNIYLYPLTVSRAGFLTGVNDSSFNEN